MLVSSPPRPQPPAVCFLLRMLSESRQAHLVGMLPRSAARRLQSDTALCWHGGRAVRSNSSPEQLTGDSCIEIIPSTRAELAPGLPSSRQTRHPTHAQRWGNRASQEEEALAATETGSRVPPPPHVHTSCLCNLPRTPLVPEATGQLRQGRNARTSRHLASDLCFGK